jgi:two-component system response regulator HydG
MGGKIKSESLETRDQININEKKLSEIEKIAILKMLDKTNNNKSKTARKLGISRRTLHLKLKSYGVMP